jgi:chromosome segregation ATPase
MKLKLQAASAEMGDLEERCRTLKAERDRLDAQAAVGTTERNTLASLLEKTQAERDAATTARGDLAEEQRTLITQRDAATAERDRMADTLEGLRRELRAVRSWRR